MQQLTASYFICVLVLLSVKLKAQSYARLTLVEGAAINFNFNTMEQMKNGITITNGTVIGVTVPDSVGDPKTEVARWEIQFRAFNGATDIQGEDPANALPLNVVEVKADDQLNLGIGAGLWTELDAAYQVLFTTNDAANIGLANTGWTNKQFSLSYRCGANGTPPTNSVFGYPSDYYTVEVEVLFVPYDTP